MSTDKKALHCLAVSNGELYILPTTQPTIKAENLFKNAENFVFQKPRRRSGHGSSEQSERESEAEDKRAQHAGLGEVG